jgi:hypothetical protein
VVAGDILTVSVFPLPPGVCVAVTELDAVVGADSIVVVACVIEAVPGLNVSEDVEVIWVPSLDAVASLTAVLLEISAATELVLVPS